jgi:hypothetical protein
MNQSPFYAKIFELQQDDQLLQNCLELCHRMDSKTLHRQMDTIRQEAEETTRRLQNDIQSSRSPAISRLAEAQRSYYLTVQSLIEHTLPVDLHSEATTPGEDQAEAITLCAEYALDFARQSIRHALFIALAAVDAQQNQDAHTPKQEEESAE